MKKKEIFYFIQSWTQKNIISKEQAEIMREDVSQSVSEKSGRHMITILLYCGVAAISAGILLVIASNWSDFPRELKLMMILLLPIIPFVFTYINMTVRQKETPLIRAVNILSFAFIGGALALVDQTYNLDINWTPFVWLWALLLVPYVVLFRKKENTFFLAVMGGLVLFTHTLSLLGPETSEQTALIVFSAITVLYVWVIWVLSRFVKATQTYKSSSEILKGLSGKVLTIFLYITTFRWYADLLIDSEHFGSNPSNLSITISIVLNLIFLGYLARAARAQVTAEEYSSAYGIVRIFMIYLLTKYITLFGGMLDTGIFLVLGGAIFVGGAIYFEKKKTHFVTLLRDEEKGSNEHEYEISE